jgi:hypothetical protein
VLRGPDRRPRKMVLESIEKEGCQQWTEMNSNSPVRKIWEPDNIFAYNKESDSLEAACRSTNTHGKWKYE